MQGMRSKANTYGLVLPAALLLAGCVVQTSLVPESPAEAIRAEASLPAEEQLAVGIQVLDPGIYVASGSSPAASNLFAEVRHAEARYLPVQLKQVLEQTGFWSSVRVLPQGVRGGDLVVSGQIVVSTGKELELEIEAEDASGEVWLQKRYVQQADNNAYFSVEDEEALARDPFHRLYVDIADDLLLAKKKRSSAELAEIRRISRLRLGSELAPAVYGSFLEQGRGGRWRPAAVPASDKPLLAHLSSAEQQDLEVLQRLDGHYGDFYAQMKTPYDDWRAYSYGEQIAFEQLRRSGQIRKTLGVLAILGALVMDVDDWDDAALRDAAFYSGIAAFESGMAKSAEALAHLASLRQLGESFESEIAPMVVDIEGETVELTGSAEAQFISWRAGLQEAWAKADTFSALSEAREPAMFEAEN